MNLLNLLSYFVQNPWLGYPIFIAVIVYLLLNPEKVEKWGSLFLKLFAYVSVRAEKRHIGLDIQSTVNLFQKQINREVEGLLPYGIKIEWVGEDVTPESFLAEGKVIIRLGHHKNRDENVIRVISEYIAQALVPEIKHHLCEEIRRAIDFTLVRKVLNKIPSALNRFYETRYKPEVEEKPVIEEFCKMLEEIDRAGWFTRIFLRELKEAGIELKDRFPDENVNEEVVGFLRFLHRIVTKRQDESVPLLFLGKLIKTSIALIARPEAVDLEPHKKRIRDNVLRGVRSFYLAARGTNVELVKFLANGIDNWEGVRRLDEIKPYKINFGGRKMNAICIRYITISYGF